MKAKVDEDLCIGCGLCVEICVDVFEMDDAIAVVVADPVPAQSEELCREAAESCPVEAISIAE
ncbi:MAG: ferredoxin [Kiritimatiellae bacterium]|nr:ferredoxin [Kiritimatiellia bacterium]